MQSPPLTSPTQQQPQSNSQALGGLGDAFGSLSFSQPAQQPKPIPFSNFTAPSGHSRQSSQIKSPPPLSGGGFFDAKPAPASKPASPPVQTTNRPPSNSFGADFGDFSSAPSPVTSAKSPPAASSTMGDLFDMSAPAPPPKQVPAPAPAAKQPPPINYSAFNLSQPSPAPAAAPAPKPAQSPMANLSMSSADAWGSNEAWATPDPEPARPPPPATQTSSSSFKSTPAPAVTSMSSGFDSGWGDPEPAKPANTSTSAGGFSVQQDEEFGGWSHASPVASTSGPKQGGLGGNADDLFGNVWE